MEIKFNTRNITVLLAGAGAGKTTRLIQEIMRDLDSLRPEDIALVSFTRKGAYEGKYRIIQHCKVPKNRLIFFKTLHSLTFNQLNIDKKSLLTKEDIKEFNRVANASVSLNRESGSMCMTEDDKILNVYDFVRSGCIPEHEAFMLVDKFSYMRLSTLYDSFKKKLGKIDFYDCLIKYLQEGRPLPVLSAYIDEAQDLTLLQWKVCQKAFSNAKKIFIAGDDCQSIYTYAGARPDILISLANTYKTVKLETSYRLPKKIYAFSKLVMDKIEQKIDKKYAPAKDEDGTISYVDSWAMMMKLMQLRKNEGWLLLFRHNYIIDRFEEFLQANLVLYFRNDEFVIPSRDLRLIEKYYNFRKEGFADDATKEFFKRQYGIKNFNDSIINSYMFDERKRYIYSAYLDEYSLKELKEIQANPDARRIQLSTIHRVKGAECDNVVVFMDATERIFKQRYADFDSELRLLYVAVTRAKHNLYLVRSVSKYGIDDIIDMLISEFSTLEEGKHGIRITGI